MSYHHLKTLAVPAQVSCLSCVRPQQLLVGSDDGSVRLYSLDTFRVLRAIRGLGPIASVALHSQSPTAHLWVASGRQVHRYSLETDKLILSPSDILQTLDICVDDDDNLGELSINTKGTKMAFCTDSGSVGVVDLQTSAITHMKHGHNNVCGSICFVPGRPSELVTGGYDYAMLHFDFIQGSILSRDDLCSFSSLHIAISVKVHTNTQLSAAALPSSGVSLSPPFILCLSISPTGVVAAGTADGRLYVGTGGEKSSEGGRQKRQRGWRGFDADSRVVVDVAEGPIVALAFTKPRELLTCTLLGKVTRYQICGIAASGTLKLEPHWKGGCLASYKVNSIAFSGESVIIGGFRKDGTGVIEVWSTR